MEALYIYLIKSSGLIALFYLAYYFMLRKETFFTSNRWFLLLGLFTSVVLPLVVYTKIILVAPSPKNIDWSRIPVTNSIENETFEINWYLVFGMTYAIGIILFLGKFAFDFYSLHIVLKGKTSQNQADFKFVDTTENVAPFSYFNTIVYNSSLYSSSELENILEHEKVHSEQNHTVDVLISRLFCILFWFNPLIWLYKKAILQNLEFIADNEATKKVSDIKAYQFTLLKITTHENCVAITNHFYQSLIKKRIVMLNKNQSKKWNSWKYALVVPALIAFVLLFQIEVVAQEKVKKIATTVKESSDKESQTELNQSTTDTIKKTKKITVQKTKKGNNDEVTTIYIDGKIATQAELDAVDVDVIKTTNVNKDGDKSTIKIITKNTKGIPDDTQIFVNGKKISKEKFDELDPNEIETINVNKSDSKNSNQNTIKVVTKKRTQYLNNKDLPALPTPPTPPKFPNGPMPTAPKPDMSRMPVPPTPPKDKTDRKAMVQFEKKMKEFENKMEAFEPDMRAYEKEVEEVMAKREQIFEKEMAKYEEAMEKYREAMEKRNN
jgi:hypothetical protein